MAFHRRGAPDAVLHPRGHEQVAAYFEGLELVDPGVVPIHLWQPEPGLFGVPAAVDESGGIGRKP